MMRDDWIQTFTGKAVCPAALTCEDVCIEDIAHSLSMQCRFTGHCKEFYSVAEHSVEVSRLLVRADYDRHALWGLLHDASEAYLVDVAAPMKRTKGLESFRELEHQILGVICRKFGLPKREPLKVKWADKTLLETEALQFMAPLHGSWKPAAAPLERHTLVALPPSAAKSMFLAEFHRLTDNAWRGKEAQ